MEQYKHRLFVTWLIYIVAVLAIFVAGWFTNLLPLSFYYDKSYFSILVVSFYFLYEGYSAYLFSSTSSEMVKVEATKVFLNNIKTKPSINIDNNVVITDGNDMYAPRHVVESKYLSNHIRNLVQRQNATNSSIRLEQGVLKETLEDGLWNDKAKTGTMRMMVLELGLVGTVVGIIMTFWPYMTGTAVDLTQIQNLLPLVFSSVGAVFFPTVYTAICSLFLVMNERLMDSGLTTLSNTISEIIEIHIIPALEK